MGLLETELKELRQYTKHYLAGKISTEQAQTVIGFSSQIEKRIRIQLQIMAMAEKYGKRYHNRLVKANLIGNGTVIDLSPEEIEEEKILCPHKDVHVTRSECLDFSGTAENMDTCAGCEEGIANKRLLVGDTPLFTA